MHTHTSSKRARGETQPSSHQNHSSPRAVQQCPSVTRVTVCVCDLYVRECQRMTALTCCHVLVWCECVHMRVGGLTPGRWAGIGCCGGESYVRGGRDSVYVVELTEH